MLLINKTKVVTNACIDFIQVTVLFTTFTDTADDAKQKQNGSVDLYSKSVIWNR